MISSMINNASEQTDISDNFSTHWYSDVVCFYVR